MTRSCPSTQVHRRRSGFTLLEVLIVVALLAVIAGMVFPRLTGNAHRATMITTDDLADLLTLFAHRDSMGAENIAIGYDPQARAVMMMELIGDPQDSSNPLQWRMDRYLDPVRLPDALELVSVFENETQLSPNDDWVIPIMPGQGRPSITLTVRSDDVELNVSLPAHALAARVMDEDDRESQVRKVVDLDALGRDQEVW